jgi:hypothetical protein
MKCVKLTVALVVSALLMLSGPAEAGFTIIFEGDGGTVLTDDISGPTYVKSGVAIPIDNMRVYADAVKTHDTAVSNGLLTFDTGNVSNFLSVVGGIPALSIADGTTLIGNASFSAWTVGPALNAGEYWFQGLGPDEKDEGLLDALGIPTDTPWEFYNYELTWQWDADLQVGAVKDALVENDAVPEPATLLIWSLLVPFGILVWRRRRKAA